MRSRFPFVPSLLLAAVLFTPLRANAGPEGHYHWITPVAGYGTFSDKFFYPGKWPLENAPVFGARLGTQWSPSWGLELAGAYSSAGEDRPVDAGVKTKVLNASANLMYQPTTWRLGALYLAAGFGYNRYDADSSDQKHFYTFEQALGLRSWWSAHTALRLEARNILNVPSDDWGGANKANQQFLAGIDLAWGGRPKDTDADGVPDRKDKCAATPVGAKVDETGCPIDSDGDGEFDG